MWCPCYPTWTRVNIFDAMIDDARQCDASLQRYRAAWAALLPTPATTGLHPLEPACILYDAPRLTVPLPCRVLASQADWDAYLQEPMRHASLKRDAVERDRRTLLDRCKHAGALAAELYSWRSLRAPDKAALALQLAVAELADAVATFGVDFACENLVILTDAQPSSAIDVYAYHYCDGDGIDSYICPAPIGVGPCDGAHHCFVFKVPKAVARVRVIKLRDARPHTVDEVFHVIDNNFEGLHPCLHSEEVAVLECPPAEDLHTSSPLVQAKDENDREVTFREQDLMLWCNL